MPSDFGKPPKKSSFFSLLGWGKIFAALTLFAGYFYHLTWLELSGTSTYEFPIEIWEVPLVSFHVFKVFIREIFSSQDQTWKFILLGFVALLLFLLFLGLKKIKPLSQEAKARVWDAARWPALFVGITIFPTLLVNVAIFLLGAVFVWMIIPSYAAKSELAYQEAYILKELREVFGSPKTSTKTNLFFAITKDDPVAPVQSIHPRIHRQCGATKCLIFVYNKKDNTLRAEVIPAETVIRIVRGINL